MRRQSIIIMKISSLHQTTSQIRDAINGQVNPMFAQNSQWIKNNFGPLVIYSTRKKPPTLHTTHLQYEET